MKGIEVVVQNVSRTYGDFKALNNVSLSIQKGEFFSILGPSGCGKTTLLRLISGFDQPDSGKILLGNKDVTPIPPEKRIVNTVFQNYALFPHLTVFENVAFPLRLKKVDEETIKKSVRKYVHMVRMDEHINKKPSQLSGGQKQRIAIARALINEPAVLLLDEPLSALDAKLRQNLLIELDDLHDKVGITFIYITHDQSEALSVSDRIAVMNEGEILQIGNPYEIYESPTTNFVAKFIGETNLFEATVKECIPYQDEFLIKADVPKLSGEVTVTDIEPQKPNTKCYYSVRPEKIHISLEKPLIKQGKIVNLFQGYVDEPIYSGFQSKYFVKLQNNTMIKVFKQHVNYLDDGPQIDWKDKVYVSWSALDGYLVKGASDAN